ncbi:hypothetical protein FQN53_008987 [Emmonsiellopsis sp. PD_33]|nr:hypothetical protein FQN53_008987 [Emmonsiellopsis sp. PD_33]
MERKVDDDKIGPGAELRDPVRLGLLKEIHNRLDGFQVPQKAQASLLLCDISALESLVRIMDEELGVDAAKALFLNSKVDEIVAEWCQKSSPSSRTGSPARSVLGSPKSSPLSKVALSNPSPETQVPEEPEETEILSRASKRKRVDSPGAISLSSQASRSSYVAKECKNRDSQRCIITKFASATDAAHIVPFSLYRKDRRANFFELLRVLWSERVGQWKHHLDNGTESIENMLTFTPTLHRCHAAGLFGLQPIEASGDGKSLKLKFYWLAQRETPGNNVVDITDIPTLADDVELASTKISSSEDGHIINSGEVIELTTSNPETLPLPSWDLLELQWILQRLTALKGAADIPDVTRNESDEEDLGGLGYDEEIFDEGSGEWRNQGADVGEENLHERINDWIHPQAV